jgi:hypothetical protein
MSQSMKNVKIQNLSPGKYWKKTAKMIELFLKNKEKKSHLQSATLGEMSKSLTM